MIAYVNLICYQLAAFCKSYFISRIGTRGPKISSREVSISMLCGEGPPGEGIGVFSGGAGCSGGADKAAMIASYSEVRCIG